MNEKEITNAELLPATLDSARTLALIANETPEVIMARAVKCAKVLQDVISKKKNPVKMNGEIYFEIEDWSTLGNFYNGVARVLETNFIQCGSASGFEAKAAVMDKLTGQTISTAEAMCLNDEEKWSTRSKYEQHYVLKDGSLSAADPGAGNIIWEANPFNPGKKRPKKQKVKVGEVSVPMFQLRSMAQTRACAKALRLAYGWVVVLAGYKATPAEELDGMTDKDTGTNTNEPAEPRQAPQRKSAQAEPTTEELKALADKKAAEYHKGSEAAEPTPSDSGLFDPTKKVLKGLIAAYYAPTGRGPHKFFIQGEYCQTFDDDLAQMIIDHKEADDEVEIACHVEKSTGKNGKTYENNMIDAVSVQA